jgi:hypothetical protein
MNERAALTALLKDLGGHPRALRRHSDGEWIIAGADGRHIAVDGNGFRVVVDAGDAPRLPFCRTLPTGLRLEAKSLLSKSQVETLREVLGLKSKH